MGKVDEPSSGIKVAVRLRPFNGREKKKNCKLVVDMDNNGSVTLDMTSEGKGKKKFCFDFAFWSFDKSRKRATQDTIYNDLGFFVPEALKGFNCSIFAYGQTGAGKSYSMMGPVDDPGIIYRGLQDFFEKRNSAPPETKIELEVSFLEIYNEEVGDLLVKKNNKKLRVRVSKKKGVYVQGLTIKAVGYFKQAKWLIDMGFNNRSVASTNMNATSSRSHCIFTMYIKKVVRNKIGKTSSATESKVSLIDLAGSERQDKTGASGSRLREANAINQSLSALGNVISALSKGEKFIPYRSSVLTLLLRESLGGNAKTIMVCAISPADDNAMETWGTLKYAARVKEIVNKVTKNESEDPAVIITKLKEEVKKMKLQLGKKTNSPLADELAHLQTEIERKTLSHEKRCHVLKKEVEEQHEELAALGLTALLDVKADENTPRLINVSPDPMMSGKLIYFVSFDVDIMIGTKTRENPDEQRIVLICSKSSNIKEEHALLHLSADKVMLTPNHPDDPGLFVNGRKIAQMTGIFHNDRIVFGNGRVCFHFISPTHPSPKPTGCEVIDYEAITLEIQEKDEEVIKLQQQLKADRANQLAREGMLKLKHIKMELELKQMIEDEATMRKELEEQIKSLKDNANKKTDEASVESPKDEETLTKKLKMKERGRISLQKTLMTQTQMISSCKRFDTKIENQVNTAIKLCQLSQEMAKFNNSNSHYYPFTIPFWNDKFGVLSEKVMILETYQTDNCYIDSVYDCETFEMRHDAHADYEFRDKSKMFRNPFVPDLSLQTVGFVNIKDTNLAMDPQEFSILPIGESTGCRGKIIAWLDIMRDEGECEIELFVDNIIVDGNDDPSLRKVLTFVNTSGMVEMVEGGLADDGESFYFPVIKMLAECSPGLDEYLLNPGIKILVSVYGINSETLLPCSILNNLMECQIELKRCGEEIGQFSNQLRKCKKELQMREFEIEGTHNAYQKIVRELEAENRELRRAAKCPLRDRGCDSCGKTFSCCLPLPKQTEHNLWKLRPRIPSD